MTARKPGPLTLCSEQFLLKFKLNFDSGEQSNPQRELNTKIFKTPIEIVKQLRFESRQNYKNVLFSFNILRTFYDQLFTIKSNTLTLFCEQKK
jgi:hypothetical protein